MMTPTNVLRGAPDVNTGNASIYREAGTSGGWARVKAVLEYSSSPFPLVGERVERKTREGATD